MTSEEPKVVRYAITGRNKVSVLTIGGFYFIAMAAFGVFVLVRRSSMVGVEIAGGNPDFSSVDDFGYQENNPIRTAVG